MTPSGMRYQSAPGRRSHILARLREVGFLSCAELAQELGVSQMTVRRDLRLLESGGHIRTVHGGATLATALRRPLLEDYGDNDALRRIAYHATQFLGDDDTIAVDAGGVGYHLVQGLPPSFHGCVITHSMPVMQLLAERPSSARLVALGGELMPARRAFAGPATLEAISQLRARTFFLSAAAVDARGLYAPSVSEASVQRRLMNISDQIVLLAPQEVFTGSAPALIGSLDGLTAVIADRPPPRNLATAFTRAGISVHVVTTTPDRVTRGREGSPSGPTDRDSPS